ncbi:MAG: ABC transporter permease, partial [Gemmatimonadetes bacterium]|nr:ABC transporter permease [Gemmatimonadota bacterium]NIR80334.1 ABC transporter permease [Gemmatimonadota bacterium]NIT89097.1 ABC transporter permease [Gemmatimonadota bacterium]NIU32894.1 ABC transporter permease [Gemmatimonadota bacterium]NIU37648.1 ABC transporter permease [Gemmatimonadota bacterium]
MSEAWLRIRRLAVKELRQLLRDPKTQRIIFVAPVMQLLLFGYAVNTDVRGVATVVVDHDRTRSSRELVEALTADGTFRIVEASDDPGRIAGALDRGDAVTGVWIPPGFARDLGAGRSPAVQILVDGTNSNTATVAQGYAQRIVLAYGAEGGPGAARATPGGVELRPRAWFNPSLESRVYNVPAVIGVIVLLMCLLLTALAVVRERELG